MSIATTPFVETGQAEPPRIRLWLLLATSLGGVVALFWNTGRTAMVRWDVDPASSHGYIVPLVVGYLVWQRWQATRPRLPDHVPTFTLVTGGLSVLIGVLFHLYLVPALEPGITVFPDGLCFVVTVLGLLLMIAGPDTGKVYLPAFLMLFFMVPLPLSWQQPGADLLQQIVAWTSEMTLWILGQTVYREGYIIYLPDTVLEVAEGCSGLRQLVVFVGIGAFFGVHSGNSRHAAFLILLSLPVSVAANTLRITFTGLIHVYAGREWAEGVLHEAEGLVTALIGVAALFGIARLLNRWTGNSTITESSPELPENDSRPVHEPHSVSFPLQLCVVVLFLPAIALDHHIQRAAASYRRPPVALQAALNTFPKELGPWVGQDTPVEREYFLYGDDHLNRIYVNRKTGQTLTLWMVYTTDGRNRIHHPRVCMKAIGCQEVVDRTQQVSLGNSGQPALQLYFRQPANGSGQWVVYWNHALDLGVPIEHSPLLNCLAAPPSKRSGLTLQVFAPDLAPADSQGATEFAAIVHEQARQTLIP
jgi:exosortase